MKTYLSIVLMVNAFVAYIISSSSLLLASLWGLGTLLVLSISYRVLEAAAKEKACTSAACGVGGDKLPVDKT